MKDKDKSFHERYIDSFTSTVVLGTLAVVTITTLGLLYRSRRA